MQMKTFVWTLSAGIAVGAAAAIVLPKNKQVKQAVSTAADSIGTAVSQVKDYVQNDQA